jgi:hypothetical protein
MECITLAKRICYVFIPWVFDGKGIRYAHTYALKIQNKIRTNISEPKETTLTTPTTGISLFAAGHKPMATYQNPTANSLP